MNNIDLKQSSRKGQTLAVNGLPANVNVCLNPSFNNVSFNTREVLSQKIPVREMVRLDDFLSEKENYNFLTIDVQGYELEVLKGSCETLTNISGILTEVNRDELYSNCVRVEQLDDFLKNFDLYRVETNWEGGTWGDAFYLKK